MGESRCLSVRLFYRLFPVKPNCLNLSGVLIYAAYFALRNAIDVEEKRGTLSAVYSIFAFVTVPFLIFVVPRMVPSLHPSDSIVDENMKFTMGPTVRIIFFSSLALFTVLFFWMFSVAVRVQKLVRAKQEEDF